jgi:ribosomal protein S21
MRKTRGSTVGQTGREKASTEGIRQGGHLEILIDSTNKAVLEEGLRRLKKSLENEGFLKDLKRHEFHIGPGERRRIKSLAARRRVKRVAAKKAQRAAWRDKRGGR